MDNGPSSSVSKPIVIVGEAWGEQEAKISKGFCGPSGLELLRMLHEAGIISLDGNDRSNISDYYRTGSPQLIDRLWLNHGDQVFRTNVFNRHPPGNKLEWFCGGKAEGIASYGALLQSRYVRKEFEAELDRLADEVLAVDPNLIIALGGTALWAFTGRTGITKLRGTTLCTTHCASGFKLLPTYHPSAVLRQWELRPTTLFDLIKAKREAEFPDLRRPACEIWIEPSLADIERFINDHVRGCEILSVDIETTGSRITCIGFAPGSGLAIVIPFDDERSKGGSYWPDRESEVKAWALIRGVLTDRAVPKLFQNGLYDIAFLWRAYGIGVMGAQHDTMLLHHALQPESLKGLGYMGSIYTDHGPWKHERKATSTIKRDE